MINSVVYKLLNILPDRMFLSLKYFKHFKRFPNWEDPKTFSEKLQWLKLYNRIDDYTTMVDKYAAKEYVSSIIGEEYIIPTLGVWEKAEDIEWGKLPNQFVLKCTHDSGTVIIVRDKSIINQEEITHKLSLGLKRDFYSITREWPYKKVPKRIIAEQYLDPSPNKDLPDYKFSCFNGKVTDVMVCVGRETGNTKFYFFDKEWNLLPLNIRGKNAPSGFKLSKPQCMDKMFELASVLSKGLPYARIDLYAIGNHPYFGEITFYPQSGFDNNLLLETEVLYGSLINLPNKTK